jgi:hypothetical protein
MCKKRTLEENSSMGHGVRLQRKRATRLAYKACFKGSVESNMEPTLGQYTKMQVRLEKHNETPFNVIFNDPREGKLGSFFMFEKEDSKG